MTTALSWYLTCSYEKAKGENTLMSATECVILDILMKCASLLVISIDAFDMWTSDLGYFDEMCLVLISM